MDRKQIAPSADRDYLRRKRIVSIVSLAVFLAFIAVISITVGKPLVQMVSKPEQFRQWVYRQAAGGRLAFVGMMCLQVVVAVIPGEPLEIGAGYAFGAWEGMALCLAGAAVGSSLIYGFTRLLGVRMVEAFISREKMMSLRFLRDAKKRNLLVFVLFLIPGTPKDVLTYFIGLTPMRLGSFLVISTIARIPSVISSTLGGDALGLQDYTLAVLVFAVTAVLSIAGLVCYRLISRRQAPPLEEQAGRQTAPPLSPEAPQPPARPESAPETIPAPDPHKPGTAAVNSYERLEENK